MRVDDLDGVPRPRAHVRAAQTRGFDVRISSFRWS